MGKHSLQVACIETIRPNIRVTGLAQHLTSKRNFPTASDVQTAFLPLTTERGLIVPAQGPSVLPKFY
jgi:hypothetical protein